MFTYFYKYFLNKFFYDKRLKWNVRPNRTKTVDGDGSMEVRR